MDEKKFRQDLLNSIDTNKIDNISSSILQKYQLQKENEKKKVPWYKSKILYFVGSPLLCAGVALAIILPLTTKNDGSNNNPLLPPGDYIPGEIKGKHNEVAFSVLSAANILTNNSLTSPLLKQRINQNDFKEAMTSLNPYMSTSEVIITNGLQIEQTIVESDNPDYEFKMIIKDNNNDIEFYYNEYDKDGTLDHFDDDDDDEIEEEYHIRGIFVTNGTTYNVVGDKELENEANESEYELTLQVDLNNNNKLIIEQEIESENNEEEQSFVYTLIENNRQVFSVELSFEQEVNKNMVAEISIEKQNHEAEYVIFKSNDSNYDFNLNYEINDEEGNINVSIINNGEGYRYEETRQNFYIELPRN